MLPVFLSYINSSITNNKKGCLHYQSFYNKRYCHEMNF